MPTKGVIEMDGELYCVDLEAMLSDPNVPTKYLIAVKAWLEKVQEQKGKDATE